MQRNSKKKFRQLNNRKRRQPTEDLEAHKDYQQALEDFCLTDLLDQLSNFSDADFKAFQMNLMPEELSWLGAILIQQLTNSLNGKHISGCLNAIRHGEEDVLPTPINLEVQPSPVVLPSRFPNGETPRYTDGTRLKWILPNSRTTDWGRTIGRFYAYASHRCCWSWKYVILLDSKSPSAAWVMADTAWEEDLEQIVDEVVL